MFESLYTTYSSPKGSGKKVRLKKSIKNYDTNDETDITSLLLPGIFRHTKATIPEPEEEIEYELAYVPTIRSASYDFSPSFDVLDTPSFSNSTLSTSDIDKLIRTDIEDLLVQEDITHINGKKIKFGNKGLRSANASFGSPNSNHKKRDPNTGNAFARDISIPGGTNEDYAKFREVLLSNQRVRDYMEQRNWGIINEITPAAYKRYKSTGPHFHFGPDTAARRTWAGWLKTPDVDVTKLF